MANRHPLRTVWLLITALGVLALQACGGGGSSAPEPVTTLPPSTGTGAVGIVLTDAPVQGWDRAMATITRIDLLGDDGPVNVFTGTETLDLLDLQSYGEIFALAHGVPAGDYEKIRLTLASMSLQRLEDDGSVAESRQVELPGNGKLDIEPGDAFRVTEGGTLVIQLDFDMEKSLKITLTGNDRLILRPVILASVLDHEGFERLTRVHGIVRELDDDGFELCQSGLVSRHGNDDDDDEDSDAERHCIDVTLAGDAGLFDTSGDPARSDAIQPGLELTVIGALRRDDDDTLFADDDSDEDEDDDSGDDSDDDSGDDDDDRDDDRHFDDDVVLVGHVVQIGPAGTFRRYRATATSPVDGIGEFGLAFAGGQGFPENTSLLGLVQAGTKIVSRDARMLDASAIDAGARGLFEGVLTLSNTDPDVLKTSFIVLDLDPPLDVLRGVLQQVLAVEQELVVSAEGLDRCVEVDDAKIYLSEDGGSSYLNAEITLADLVPGQRLDVFGEDGACFDAELVIASAPDDAGNARPVADAGPDQSVAVDDLVHLDGTGSSDPDGDLLSYAWTLTSAPTGSAATLSDASSATPSFTADLEGTYEVELVVNDGVEDSSGDTVVVTAASPPPVPGPAPGTPTADAGPDQSVSAGDTVQLDGTGSTDPLGSGLTYAWTLKALPAGSGAALSDPASPTPTFVADLAGEYEAELVVTNADGDSPGDTVRITATSGTGGLDGVALYGDFCAVCHNPLGSTNIRGVTAEQIQSAIDGNRGGMGNAVWGLTALTPEQVQAIADALQ